MTEDHWFWLSVAVSVYAVATTAFIVICRLRRSAVITDDELKRRVTAPYWWPETRTVQQLFLQMSIVVMVWYILRALLDESTLKIDPSVRDLIVFIFGIVFGNFKDVYNFVFGSSAGDRSKDEQISKALDKKDEIIKDGVATTVALAAASTPPTVDAMKAAVAVAPVAAAAAAPPAAEEAAPPAAREAVADALRERDNEGGEKKP